MPAKPLQIITWDHPEPPSEQEAEACLHKEGYEVFKWQDFAGTHYPVHRHPHDECIWVLKGKMTFFFAGTHQAAQLELKAGDRFYLPAGIEHRAEVHKNAPVVYLVGQKD